jgi:hypothetical protein
MTDFEIVDLLSSSLSQVIKNDLWLISHNLSEQSISNKIAYYLVTLFPDYHVDCEYNGDIDSDSNRKAINLLKDELSDFNLLRETERNDIENDLTIRSVFPDIIIHTRGMNNRNLCIIEVKKNTSSISYDYDYLKLRAYTSNEYGNTLKYQLGVFVEIITGYQHPGYSLRFFKNGIEVEENDLI